MNRMILLLAAMIPLILCSCGEEERTVLEVISDNPEAVLLGEFFNSQAEDLLIMLTYRENLTPEHLDSSQYDCVISGDLASPVYIPHLRPSEEIPQTGSGLYVPLRLQGELRNSALPLSFNLPVVVYRKEQFGGSFGPRIITPEDLQQWNQSEIPSAGFRHLGFSSLWNPAYLRYRAQLLGEDFQTKGEFQYSITLMDDLIREENQWLEENQGSEGFQFSEKYRYIPDTALLLQGRIDFIIMDLASYFSIQESQRNQLSFSYLGNTQGVRPQEVQYGAVLRRTPNKEDAHRFLEILVDSDFQQSYMEWKRTHRNSSFGYLGGLSSLSGINRQYLSNYYADWGNRVLLEDGLLPALYRPENWRALSEEMLDQWFLLYLEEETSMKLIEYYEEWNLHFIP